MLLVLRQEIILNRAERLYYKRYVVVDIRLFLRHLPKEITNLWSIAYETTNFLDLQSVLMHLVKRPS